MKEGQIEDRIKIQDLKNMEFANSIILALLACIFIVPCLGDGEGSVYADFEIYCNDTFMRVYFNKTQLDLRTKKDNSTYRPYNIAWKNQTGIANCYANNTHTEVIDESGNEKLSGRTSFTNTIWLSARYPNFCGITQKQSADHIYYNSTIIVTYGENPTGGVISREEYDYYTVSCLRERSVNKKVSGDFFNTSSRTDGEETKNNTIDYEYTFTHTDMNGVPQSIYDFGDNIKFTLDFQTNTDVKSVVQKCWATSDGSANEYKLIDNRCPSDAGTNMIDSAPKSTVWKTEAFRYVDGNDRVYIECLVRACLISDQSNECSFCASRKRRSVNDMQESTTGQMTLVKSPAFFISVIDPSTVPSQSSVTSNSILSGSNGTIIIALLACLILIVTIAVLKKLCFPTIQTASPAMIPMSGIDNKALA